MSSPKPVIIGVVADLNLSLVDGSTIWLKNIASLCADVDQSVQVVVFSRDPLESSPIVDELRGMDRVRLVDPHEVEALDDLEYRSLPTDRLATCLSLWEAANTALDHVLVRGIRYADELARSVGWQRRLKVYWMDIEYSADADRSILENMRENNVQMIAQTRYVRTYLEVFGQIHSGNITELPPMVDDRIFAESSSAAPASEPGKLRVSYSGKIDPRYCVGDLLEAGPQVKTPGVTVDVCAGKLTIPPGEEDFGESFQSLRNRPADGVNFFEGLSHQDVVNKMREADVGFCLRSDDFDASLEYSTKMLEYATLGVPPLVNRTEPNVALFGADYPLLVDYDRGNVDELRSVLESLTPEVLSRAKTRLPELAEQFKWSRSVERISAIFGLDSGRSTRAGVTEVLLASHDNKFLERATARLEKAGITFVHDEWTTSAPLVEREGFTWAGDYVFCEWCCANAVWFSHNKLSHQKLVVRLHRFELFTDAIRQVDWDAVDTVIVVSEYFADTLAAKVGVDRDKIVVAPQFIEADELDRAKRRNAAFTIGFVGINPFNHKRFDRALDFFEGLVALDDRFRLRVRSVMPWSIDWLWEHRVDERELYENLFARLAGNPAIRERVLFDPPGSDMEEWYREVGFMLSSSDTEGCHTSIFEGMASGCEPIVFAWPGARTLFPDRFVYDDLQDAIPGVLQRAASYEEDESLRDPHRHHAAGCDVSHFVELLCRLLNE